MKKIFSKLFVGLGLLSLASCVTSLQPLVTYDKMITDNRITGNWLHEGEVINVENLPSSKLLKEIQQSVGKSEKGFVFTGDPVKDSILFTKLYVVSFERKGTSYYMAAGLTKLGNDVFMELYPAIMNDPRAGNLADPFDFSNDYLPGFTMAKVGIAANGVTLKFVDGNFIKEQLKAGRMKLKHEANDLFGTFMITASTEELRSFLKKYANDERIFSKETTVSLTRKPVHS